MTLEDILDELLLSQEKTITTLRTRLERLEREKESKRTQEEIRKKPLPE